MTQEEYNKLIMYENHFNDCLKWLLYIDNVEMDMYRKDVNKLVKDFYYELTDLFYNNVVYEANTSRDYDLYIKQIWGTDYGLMIDCSTGPNIDRPSTTLYLDEIFI